MAGMDNFRSTPVYPGANHTRFQHAVGAMHLMGLAIEVIRSKGHTITEEEARAVTIAILLRFMDSFMIYTEPFVLTGGGPGNTTTFLSIDLVKIALGQFDLGPAAAMSLIYFLMVLLTCWALGTLLTGRPSFWHTSRATA